ncbi:hypothetical protein Daus18300_001719 [Diaporthe australafricana]|uniref:F-box domain-containing protein n=1 Tax=Diaporthe australafricana TaxID=127596 RepID=A0ABR3XV40_9PEZI
MDINRDKPFPILNLPRELRDNVWRYAVVRPNVFVSFDRLQDLQQRGLCPIRPLRTCLDCHKGALSETNGLHETGTYFRPRNFEDFFRDVRSESYHFLASSHYELSLQYPGLGAQRKENEHPNLSIFLTCRQASAEAMVLYYSENTFVFCFIDLNISNMSSVNAALAFLHDRPRDMLLRIKHIQLYINSGYTHGFYFGIKAFRNLDAQVWREFTRKLKSEMKLQHLSLHLSGLLPDFRDCEVSAKSSVSSGEGVFDWHLRITELSQLPKVSRLTLTFSKNIPTRRQLLSCENHSPACFTARSHRVCNSAEAAVKFAAMVKVFRNSLLQNGQQLGSKSIRAQLERKLVSGAGNINAQSSAALNWDFLRMQADDDCEGNCLLPQQPDPVDEKTGMDQVQEGCIDIFQPLGDSASLDSIKTRGRNTALDW